MFAFLRNSYKSRFVCVGIPAVIFIGSLLLRTWGLRSANPFWVDEFSTAVQARKIGDILVGVTTSLPVFFEPNNKVTHLLTSIVFKFFSESVTVARLPSVLAGSLTPVVVYLLVKKLSRASVAVGAALLTATAYFQIVWSVQARGYALHQLLTLVTIGMIYSLSICSSQRIGRWLLLLGIVGIGIYTHFSFFILVAAILFALVLIKLKAVISFAARHRYQTLLGTGVVLIMLRYTGMFDLLQQFVQSSFFGGHNLGYYHAFLWREYGLLTYMGILGLILWWVQKRQFVLVVIGLHIVLQLSFISFIFGHAMTKYIFVLFPYMLMGAAYLLAQLADLFTKKYAGILTLVLILLIIGNGHKFVNRPRQYYSVNHDFREIANIDYDQVYSRILPYKKANAIIIETWPDRARWYMGNPYPHIALFRWGDDSGTVNGHELKTAYTVNAQNHKIYQGVRLISSLDDLHTLMREYPVGFLLIDDTTLPEDVVKYARSHLTKEIYLDRYIREENPYSVWPATLYSWGTQSTRL